MNLNYNYTCDSIIRQVCMIPFSQANPDSLAFTCTLADLAWVSQPPNDWYELLFFSHGNEQTFSVKKWILLLKYIR